MPEMWLRNTQDVPDNYFVLEMLFIQKDLGLKKLCVQKILLKKNLIRNKGKFFPGQMSPRQMLPVDYGPTNET